MTADPRAAMSLARNLHATQVRRYTGEPYLAHLLEVAGLVATTQHHLHPTLLRISMCVAVLHDCMEDQGVAPGDLVATFGEEVDQGVILMSDLEPGNRATRKAAARERLGVAPGWVQSIKCADLISNASSIFKHDQNFAIVFRKEGNLLLDAMRNASPLLHSMAREALNP